MTGHDDGAGAASIASDRAAGSPFVALKRSLIEVGYNREDAQIIVGVVEDWSHRGCVLCAEGRTPADHALGDS